jgi:uncharacterized protein (TIGR02996 family)
MRTPGVEDSGDERRLLDAVLAAPRDDGPRLVYADWLMERGDPRGELIVVQCTRESCERTGQRATAAYRAACSRERVLLAENVKQWVDPVGLRRWWGEFSRGFITKLTISAGGLRSKWSTFARMPLQYIKLHGRFARRGPRAAAAAVEAVMLGDLSWLATQPDSNRIEVVAIETTEGVAELDWQVTRSNLIESGLTNSADMSLAWQPEYALPISPLHEFVSGLTLTNAAATHLADLNMRASSLMRSLEINGYRLDARDIALLLSMSELRGLHDLTLTQLDDSLALALLESNPRMPPRFPDLRKLVVLGRDRMGLGSSVARALGSNRALQTIESLRVDAPLDEALVRALDTKAVQLKHLVVLGPANDYAIDALARSALVRRLETLSLVGAQGGTFGPPSIMPLLRADLARL